MSKFYNQGYMIKKKFLEIPDKTKIILLLKQNLFKQVPYLKKNNDLENQIFHDQLIKLRLKKNYLVKYMIK